MTIIFIYGCNRIKKTSNLQCFVLDSYEVLFDDGFVKVVKSHKMMKIKPPQSSPLFEPAKTTKQERRDRKRKLNVAALFSKRPKLNHTEDKKHKSSAGSHAKQSQIDTSQAQDDQSQDGSGEASTTWHPT